MCKELERIAKFYGATIVDYDFPSSIRYAYHNGVIGINKKIVDNAARRCVLALGVGRHLMHINKCIGFTEEQSNGIAMQWAVSFLMPFNALVQVAKRGLNNATDTAKFLRVTPEFVLSGIEIYKNTFGSRILCHDCVIDLENGILEPLKEVG